MKEEKISTKTLECLLTPDARKFLDRAKEYFKADDIMWHISGHDESLGFVLNSLNSLTANQDVVFELLSRQGEMPSFMPVGSMSLINCGNSLAKLASKRNDVVELFKKFSQIGYDRFQFRKVYDDEGNGSKKEIDRFGFNVSLASADGILKIAGQRDLTIGTLRRFKDEFGKIPPLYSAPHNYESFGWLHTYKGICFNPDDFLWFCNNFDDVVTAVKGVGIIDREISDLYEYASVSALYMRPAGFARLGKRINEVERYARLVRGEPKLNIRCINLEITSSILRQIDDPNIIRLFEGLQPYAARDGEDNGLDLWLFSRVNGEESYFPKITEGAHHLAAEHSDKVIKFAKVMRNYRTRFNLSDLAEDYDGAVALLKHTDDLDRFVERVTPFRSPADCCGKLCELYSIDDRKGETRLQGYERIVREGLMHHERTTELIEKLSRKHGLRFVSNSLLHLLETSAIALPSEISPDFIGMLHPKNGTYYLSNLGYAARQTQQRAA